MGSHKLTMAKGIYYQQYGDFVYLRDVRSHKDYIFNEIVGDILDCIREAGSCTCSALADQLSAIYQVKDVSELEKDLVEFTDDLVMKSILLTVKACSVIGEKVAEVSKAQETEDPGAESESSPMNDVLNYCGEHHVLYSLDLELTYRCNERCIHCYGDTPCIAADELTLDDYKKLLTEAREEGCISVLLTGGEVNMKPEWIDIAEYASKLGMAVDIYSNGLVLADDIFERICALAPNSYSFSLYGSTPEIHDAVTQIPGSFQKTLRNAIRIRDAGIETFLKTVVMKCNADDLENLFKLGRRLNISVQPGLTIFDTYGGVSRQDILLSSVQEYQSVLNSCRDFSPQVFSVVSRDICDAACNAGQSSLTIDPYGNIYVCMSIREVLGNVKDQGIAHVWNNAKRLDEIRAIRFCDLCNKCSTCSYVDFCSICMGRLDLKHPVIPKDICMIAQASAAVARGSKSA